MRIHMHMQFGSLLFDYHDASKYASNSYVKDTHESSWTKLNYK